MSVTSRLHLPPSLQPGDIAPDFTLPTIHRNGTIALSDYKGRTPLLLALFRGLYCPFCRRAIAQLATTATKLEAVGVETLAVVATQVERARVYFRYRPARLALAADPELTTFRAFRVPRPAVTSELEAAERAVRTTLAGLLREPMSIPDAANALDEQDGFEWTTTDNEDHERQYPQLVGQFLLDRQGTIRWLNIEAAREGMAGIGLFPTDEEFLAAAATLR
jgi:peroxiredoxin